MKELRKVLSFGQKWTIHIGKRFVGEIHKDPWFQVSEIVLFEDTTRGDHLEALRLAATHVRHYVKHRERCDGIIITHESQSKSVSPQLSPRLMDFSLVPDDIKKMDKGLIIQQFNRIGIDVIFAVCKTVQEAVDVAMSTIPVEGLTYKIISQEKILSDEFTIHCSVKAPHHFTFWNEMSIPSPDLMELHLVPHYHPVMHGWKPVGMVNGDTDAYIRGTAVRSIYCPHDAQAIPNKRHLFTSWDHVNHPFRAIGQSFDMRIVANEMRSSKGIRDLSNVLLAALGLSKSYVSVSGGFRAPMKCAHNRLFELGRRSPWPDADTTGRGSVARGSEEHCVWSYRTLKEEGELEKSFVPSWFISEGWLDIYKDAEVKHGLF